MRCLYLNHNVRGTGTYQRAFNLAREVARHGHDVTVVTTSRTRLGEGTERQLDGVRVIEAPDLLARGGRNGWDPWNTSWRVRRLARERFDLVHGFDCRPTVIVPALLQQRRTGAVLFLDWADWWGRGGTIVERSGRAVQLLLGPFETWLEESFRTRATANTTISAALRERCVGLGVPPDRVAVLPNGCAPPVHADRARARAALRLNDDPLIVHLGVMQRLDAALLFDAFRLLLQELPAARLVLIGGYHGPVPPDLVSAVSRTGYVDETTLGQWLGAADAGVIPLRDTIAGRGRWPGKVNEYLTAGLPVVLPRVGAAAEYVAGAGAGIVCDAEPGSMARTLVTALTADEAARARMGEACRSLAAGPLAWGRIGAELIDFYATWLRRDATSHVTTSLNQTAS